MELNWKIDDRPAVDRQDVDKCAHLMGKVSDVRPVAILSLVGGGMRASVGVAGRFFQALSMANVNVLAIGQGATERSISAVVAEIHCHGGGERLLLCPVVT